MDLEDMDVGVSADPDFDKWRSEVTVGISISKESMRVADLPECYLRSEL